MKKTTKRGILIAIGVTAPLVIIGVFVIYFVTQFSAPYPHLKDYEYSTSIQQLEKDIIHTLKSDSSLTYEITDTTAIQTNPKYYMTIKQNINNNLYTYYITYTSDNLKSKIGLVGVFDSVNKYGGYKSEDKYVDKLVDNFDKQIISKINAAQADR